jgi:hypothetical protein
LALTCYAQVLAWESATHNVNGWEIVSSNAAHIIKPLRLWPMVRQHRQARFIFLDLCNALHSCVLKAKIKPAYAGE